MVGEKKDLLIVRIGDVVILRNTHAGQEKKRRGSNVGLRIELWDAIQISS